MHALEMHWRCGLRGTVVLASMTPRCLVLSCLVAISRISGTVFAGSVYFPERNGTERPEHMLDDCRFKTTLQYAKYAYMLAVLRSKLFLRF